MTCHALQVSLLALTVLDGEHGISLLEVSLLSLTVIDGEHGIPLPTSILTLPLGVYSLLAVT